MRIKLESAALTIAGEGLAAKVPKTAAWPISAPGLPAKRSISRRSFLVSASASLTLARPAIANRPDKVVCAHYPPLMINRSERPGSSVEIVLEAARYLNRSIDITFLPFRRAIKVLQRRPNYLQPALYLNLTRAPLYTWVAKTHTVHNVFNTLEHQIDTLTAARSLDRIGVETDAAMDVLLTRHGFANLIRVDKPEVSAEQLLKGHVDAWALTRSLAHWTWSQLGYPETLVSGQTIETADVYLVASKVVSPGLVEDYAGAVAALIENGFVARTLRYYERPTT